MVLDLKEEYMMPLNAYFMIFVVTNGVGFLKEIFVLVLIIYLMILY